MNRRGRFWCYNNYNQCFMLKLRRQNIMQQWLVGQGEYIMNNPLSYIILTGANLYFYFNQFGSKYYVLIMFIWSVLASIAIQLEKYHITHLLDTNRAIGIWGKCRIYAFIFFVLLGIFAGVYLLLMATLIYWLSPFLR